MTDGRARTRQETIPGQGKLSTTIVISTELKNLLDGMAIDRNCSASKVAAEALVDYFKKHAVKEPHTFYAQKKAEKAAKIAERAKRKAVEAELQARIAMDESKELQAIAKATLKRAQGAERTGQVV